MGAVASLGVMMLFVACAWFAVVTWNMSTSQDKSGVWSARIAATFFTVLLGVHLINAYVVPVAMPFAPREIDAPTTSPAPREAPDLRLDAPQKTGPSAADEHRAKLERWEAQQAK